MSEKVKISVIVPVYNVEKYLKKCVDSLLNQTYKNIEIILVDDGSTDGSGNLCDSYAEQNKSVYVLHKQNGGLSDARNYAIPYINGKYVSYIDSDDYVDLDFFDKLAKPLDGTMGEIPDMVICTHVDEMEGRILYTDKKKNSFYQNLTPEQALKIMCYEREFGTSACGKVISKKLAEKFLFPRGKLYEDLATIYKMIGDSERIIFFNAPLYHYIQREGSIRRNKWNSSVLDVMEASQSLLDYIVTYYPEIYKDGVQRYFFSANELYIRAFNEKDYLSIILPFRKKLRGFWRDIRGNPEIRVRQKIRYWMLISCPVVYKKVWRCRYIYKEK